MKIEGVNEVAKQWDYDASVKRVRPKVMKLKTLTLDVYQDLWEARDELSHSPSEAAKVMHGTNDPRRTWAMYCDDVGLSKRNVNRWLAGYDAENRKLIEAETDALVSKFTGNQENYTPGAAIDNVRKVLGGIDLDPGSCV